MLRAVQGLRSLLGGGWGGVEGFSADPLAVWERDQLAGLMRESWVVVAVPVAGSSCQRPRRTSLPGAPAARVWEQRVESVGSNISRFHGSSGGKGVLVIWLLPALLRLRLQPVAPTQLVAVAASPEV